MSLPSIVSYGAAAKTSSLVWDGDLVIPDGYSIESASGEVAIAGDVSVSGSVAISGKQLLIAQNVGNANVTLAQAPKYNANYTSPDFPITGRVTDVAYLVPSIEYYYDGTSIQKSTFTLQGKLTDGTYQDLSSVVISSRGAGNTPPALAPANTLALRYKIKADFGHSQSVNTLNLTLTPVPVY